MKRVKQLLITSLTSGVLMLMPTVRTHAQGTIDVGSGTGSGGVTTSQSSTSSESTTTTGSALPSTGASASQQTAAPATGIAPKSTVSSNLTIFAGSVVLGAVVAIMIVSLKKQSSKN